MSTGSPSIVSSVWFAYRENPRHSLSLVKDSKFPGCGRMTGIRKQSHSAAQSRVFGKFGEVSDRPVLRALQEENDYFRIALPGMTRSASFRIGTVISGNCRVKSSHGALLAKYRYRSRRFSLVKVCTQDRNRCSPSKLILPSAATSSSFFFPRA
jgi:hypothetical protein